MKKIFSIIVALLSLTFIVNAQTFDPVIATELQNKIDSIRTANNLKGISASVIYPGIGSWKGFSVFDSQELVVGITVPEAAEMSRKEIDALIEWVKRPQIGAKGLVYVKCLSDGSFKSSVEKFFSPEDLAAWAGHCKAQAGDLILVFLQHAQPANCYKSVAAF